MDQLDGEIRDALYASMSPDEMKELTDSQFVDLIDNVLACALMICELRIQKAIRDKCALLGQADDLSTPTYIWTVDSWRNFIAGLAYRKTPIPKMAIHFANLFPTIWKFAEGYEDRSYPDSYYMPFLTRMTLTMAEQLRDAIMANHEAIYHMKKFHVPYIEFSEDLIAPIERRVDDEDILFWKLQQQFLYQDDGGTDRPLNVPGSPEGADEANFRIPIRISDGHVCNNFAMLNILSEYDVTNNPYGVPESVDAVTTNNNIGITSIAKTGTTMDIEMAVDADVRKVMINGYALFQEVDFNANSTTADILRQTIEYMLLSRDYHYKDGITSTVATSYMRQGLQRAVLSEVI
jgi:hypothetical protein